MIKLREAQKMLIVNCLCAVLTCVVAASNVQAQPRVNDVSPSTNAINVARGSQIQIDLDATLNASTIDDQSIRIFGTQSGFLSTKGTISVVSLKNARFVPDQDYFPGERIFVTVTNASDNAAQTMERPWTFSFDVAGEPALATFSNFSTFSGIDKFARWSVTGDMDGDGDLDVCMAHGLDDQVSVLLNDGSANFSVDGTYDVGDYPNGLALGDLDGDGDLDLVACNEFESDVSVLFNNGSGGLGTRVDYAVGSTPKKIEAVDLDGDGDIDLVTSSRSGIDGVSVLLNNGNGTFAAAVYYEIDEPCDVVRAADINQDGFLDLLTGHGGDGVMGVLINNGNGTFGSSETYNLDGRVLELCPGDLDGDGDIDVVVALDFEDEVAVLFNDGTGDYGVPVKYTGFVEPKAVTLADLDGDGDLDVAVANKDLSGFISVLLNDGTGALGPQAQFAATAPECVMHGDFDGDGDIDLLATTVQSNTHRVYFNADVPTKLDVASVTPQQPQSGERIAIVINAARNNGTPANVSTTTHIEVSNNNPTVTTASGLLTGTITTSAQTMNFVLHNSSTSSTTLTFTVETTAGMSLAATSVTIIIGANQAPNISTSQTAINTAEDMARTISVEIGDVETATSSLVLTATSDNQALISDSNITQQGVTAATTVFNLQPLPNANGSAEVTVTVYDGVQTNSVTFTLTVDPVNDPPSIVTSDLTVCFDEDGSTTVTVAISDVDTAPGELQLGGNSANQMLIPDAGIVAVSSTAAIRTIHITPAANAHGTTTVNLTVFDGESTQSTSLTVTVKALNDAPTITTIADVNLLFNGQVDVPFVISDVDNSIGSLFVAASSANQTLFPDSGLTLSATAANMTIDVAPECDQSGTALITISVFDGEFTSTATFMAQVAAATSAVVISGATLACPDNVIAYSVPVDAAADSHLWTAVGGEVVSGQGSASVQVAWASGIADRLELVRLFPNGCTSADVLNVSSQSLTTQLDFALTNGTTTTLSVLNNDSAGLTLISVEDPTNGTASVSGSTIVYTPALDFSGIEQFAYTVQNGMGCEAFGEVVVNVPAGFTEAINLEFIERQKDRAGGVRGLRKAYATALSPDGKFVYVAGRSDHSIATFSRDQNDGTLTYISRVRNGHNGVIGLKYVSDVLLSADGAHLYALGFGDNSVVAFERDVNSGALTFIERKKNGQVEGSGKIAGMNRPRALSIGIDGRSLYVTGSKNNAVVLFRRSVFSGRLRYVAHYKDGSGDIDGLKGALGLATSSDGRNVYVCGAGEDKLAVFSRNLVSGELQFVERLRDGGGGIEGLNTPSSVAVSPDGKHVYVAGKGDDAVAAFARSAADGSLTFVDCYKDGQAGVSGLNGVCGIAVSPDGRHVWAASSLDHSLMVFKRDAASGTLTYLGGLTDDVAGVDGLAGALSAMLNNSSQDVYVAGCRDNAVAQVFRNRAPHALDDYPGVAVKNSTLTIAPLTNDSDGDSHAMTITATTHGALGTVSIAGGGTSLQYAAGAVSGADQFIYTIEDGHGGSSTATVNVNVVAAKTGIVNADDIRHQGRAVELMIQPNPAGKRTTVVFSLAAAAEVELQLTDLRGTLVLTQMLPGLNTGEHRAEVDLRDASGLSLGSGMYILKLISAAAGQGTQIRTAILSVK